MEKPGFVPDSWEAVPKLIEKIIQASQEPFDSLVITNANDLVRDCRSLYRVPEGVAKGYWSTIRLWWPALEIEIFEDRFELYCFQNQKTDIRHFDHVTGGHVPLELLELLEEIAITPQSSK